MIPVTYNSEKMVGFFCWQLVLNSPRNQKSCSTPELTKCKNYKTKRQAEYNFNLFVSYCKTSLTSDHCYLATQNK